MKIRTSIGKALMLACMAAILCSCTDYSKITLSDFRISSIDSLKYSLKDVSAVVNSSLTVDNPFSAMTFKDFTADVVSPDGETLVEVRMDENSTLEVAAKSRTQVQAPFRVHVGNTMKLLSLGADAIAGMGKEGYVVNYTLSVGRGKAFHKISKKDVPLESLLKKEE